MKEDKREWKRGPFYAQWAGAVTFGFKVNRLLNVVVAFNTAVLQVECITLDRRRLRIVKAAGERPDIKWQSVRRIDFAKLVRRPRQQQRVMS